MVEEKKQESVRVVDALGTLSQRKSGSRLLAVTLAVAGFVLLGILLGFLFSGTNRDRIPEIPSVEL